MNLFFFSFTSSSSSAFFSPADNVRLLSCLQGEVYIQFESLDGAGKAVQGLNGRFFGGRSLVANVSIDLLFHRTWLTSIPPLTVPS